ncbi:DUF6476 family protein [Pseudodonghicola sp.]|uniref:DUF6476 family protein n=1 Tax=Pseudodonghicola sp. TaxID=1969463 RepID=UPI003A976C49
MNASPDPSNPDTQSAPEPASLRMLRRLVTTLMVVMILGVVVIVGLLVTRLSSDRTPALPDHLTLPAGAKAEAVTLGKGWVAVVTGDQRILIFDAGTGALRKTVTLD